MIKQSLQTAGYLVLAILLGMLSGRFFDIGDSLSGVVDYLILFLVFLLFLDAPLEKMMLAIRQPKLLLILWLSNFLMIPVLGFLISYYFLSDYPMAAIGLAIYFMFPCTDWFLGFTRLAGGNTGLGSVLLPINMLTQLLLYPLYLPLIAQNTVADLSIYEIVSTLTNWFLVPACAALVLKFIIAKLDVSIQRFSNTTTSVVMFALVFCIFAANVNNIIDDYKIFSIILLAVTVFFISSTLLVEIISRLFQLKREDHVLYSMTTTARNAPLLLVLTMSALPNQPMVYAVIVVGMLIEFPYLTLQVVRLRRSKSTFYTGAKVGTLLKAE